MYIWSGGKNIVPELAVLLLTIGCAHCLRCWHCIADDCDEDLTGNYKVSKKVCRPAQACQKVYFEMLERADDGRNYVHKSTVRGCSENCMDRNDFVNCSEILKTSRGCVRKDCCADNDLCNEASNNFSINKSVINFVCLFVYKLFLN